MTLEQQVVSLPIAKRLKELGCKQGSLFWHISPVPQNGWPNWRIQEIMDSHAKENYSAYTVAELGEMLPFCFYVQKKVRKWEYWLCIDRMSHGWLVSYQCKGKTIHAEVDASEANARGKMLIYLIENGLIKPE